MDRDGYWIGMDRDGQGWVGMGAHGLVGMGAHGLVGMACKGF